MSRYLCVHPGASWSTADVHSGMLAALQRQGHEIVRYNLDGRIESAHSWLQHQWRRNGRNKDRKPTGVDAHYLASYELPYRAWRRSVDWILIVSGMQLHPDAMVMSRKAGIPIAVYLTESPYEDDRQTHMASTANLVWTNERSSVPYLRQALENEHVYYLPHGYDPKRHFPGQPVEQDVPVHDVVFVGTGFQERIALLAAINWDGIDLGLYGTWELLGSRHPLRRFVRGGVTDNRRTADLYRRAKVGLNLYRTSRTYGRRVEHIQGGESLNPRALELAACGVFHLSDWRQEVEEVFGSLVPTFRDAGELEALIRSYLENTEARREIGQQLPEVVKACSFDAMARQIEHDLEWVAEPGRLVAV